jgi:DNA primase
MRRFTEKLVLAFDLDVAGENAARRGVELALKEGFAVRVLTLPEDVGKDADDAIRKDPEIWKRAIAEAVPYMEWFIGKVKGRTDNSDPEAKKRAVSELVSEIAKMPARIERDHWVRHAGEIFMDNDFFGDLGLSVEGAAKKADKSSSASVPQTQDIETRADKKPVALRPRNRYFIVSEHILAFLVTWPELLSRSAVDESVGKRLPDEDKQLYRECLGAYNEQHSGGSSLSPDQIKAVQASINHKFPERFPILQLMADKEYGELTGDARGKTFDRLIGEIKELHLSRKRRELTEAMVQAEKNGDDQAIAQIQQQLIEILPG